MQRELGDGDAGLAEPVDGVAEDVVAAHRHAHRAAAEVGARVGEIALASDRSLAEVEQARVDEETRNVMSLDAPISEDGSRLDEVVMGPSDTEADVTRQRVAEHLREACATLPPAEQRAVALRFFDDMRLKEVGDLLGVSESRVCQLCRSAAERLRRRLDERLAA